MALNGSGPISLGGSTTGQSVNLELGKSATAQISMNDAAVRSLIGVSSGAVVMPTNFWGKSSVTLSIPTSPINITTNVSGTVWGTCGAKLAFGYWGDGSYGQLSEGNSTSLGTWVTPGSAMSNYEFYATITATNGVGFTHGSYGTWLSADAAGFFGVEATAYNTLSTRSLTIQVRDKTTLATVGTFTANTSAYWSYP